MFIKIGKACFLFADKLQVHLTQLTSLKCSLAVNHIILSSIQQVNRLMYLDG